MDSTNSHRARITPDKWNLIPVPARVAVRAVTKVDVLDDGCWISRYSVASHGYAQIGWTENGRTRMVLAHRAAWVSAFGQVPLGVTLDHLCKERRCVNPGHLRMLSNYENARRNNGKDWPLGTCGNGHSNEFLVTAPVRGKPGRGSRPGLICSECRRIYQARYSWRRRQPGRPLPEELVLTCDGERNHK